MGKWSTTLSPSTFYSWTNRNCYKEILCYLSLLHVIWSRTHNISKIFFNNTHLNYDFCCNAIQDCGTTIPVIKWYSLQLEWQLLRPLFKPISQPLLPLVACLITRSCKQLTTWSLQINLPPYSLIWHSVRPYTYLITALTNMILGLETVHWQTVITILYI